MEGVDEYFKKYHENKNLDLNSNDVEEEEEENPREEKVKDKETRRKEKEEEMTFKIIEKVQNFISSDSPKLRSLALDLITESTIILSKSKVSFSFHHFFSFLFFS